MSRIHSWRRDDPHAENIQIGNGTIRNVTSLWHHDGLTVIPVVECVRNHTEPYNGGIVTVNAESFGAPEHFMSWDIDRLIVKYFRRDLKSWKQIGRVLHQYARHDHRL